MHDQPSTDELLDEISLQDTQENNDPTADFEMDGITAEEMAEDAAQQEQQTTER
jgi:hypothetical protein